LIFSSLSAILGPENQGRAGGISCDDVKRWMSIVLIESWAILGGASPARFGSDSLKKLRARELRT
jgi:hypothetical protein